MTSSGRPSPSGPTCRTATAGSAWTRAATGTCATTATQAAGPFPAAKGSMLRHDKLIDFIQRNYEHDDAGPVVLPERPAARLCRARGRALGLAHGRRLRRSPSHTRRSAVPSRRAPCCSTRPAGSTWTRARARPGAHAGCGPGRRRDRAGPLAARRRCAPATCRRASAMCRARPRASRRGVLKRRSRHRSAAAREALVAMPERRPQRPAAGARRRGGGRAVEVDAAVGAVPAAAAPEPPRGRRRVGGRAAPARHLRRSRRRRRRLRPPPDARAPGTWRRRHWPCRPRHGRSPGLRSRRRPAAASRPCP